MNVPSVTAARTAAPQPTTTPKTTPPKSPATVVAPRLTAANVGAATLKAAGNDGDGLTGAAALNDGDAMSQTARLMAIDVKA